MSAMVTATVVTRYAQYATVSIGGVATFARLYTHDGRFRQMQAGDTVAVDVSGGIAVVVQTGPAP